VLRFEEKEGLHMARCCSPITSSSATTAGQAWDDDVEEGCNGANDSLEDSGNAVDDSHDTGANGLEERLDARYDGSHFEVGALSDWILVCV